MSSRLLKCLAVIAVGLGIWIIPVPTGLNSQAWNLFAFFVATILGLILQPFSMGIVCFASLTFIALAKVLTPAQVLSGFGNGTIWLVVSAVLFSKAFVKTGLGRRIAYLIMQSIGHKTLNIAYALAISDLIIAPATPSVTARSGGVIFPIGKSVAEAFNSYPGESSRKIGAYLIQSVTHVSMVTSTVFLTAQAGNVLVAALSAKVLNYNIDWMLWFKAAIVPSMVLFWAIPFILYKFYPPEIKETPAAKNIAKVELDKMGPMKTSEKILACTFILALALWATSQWTKVDATIVGMFGITIMLLTQVLTWEDVITEKTAWDTLVWMGSIIALAGFLNTLGFIPWFSKIIGDSLGTYSWTTVLILVLIIHMYTQYAFAGLSAHVTAFFPALATVAISAGAPVPITVISLGMMSSLCGCLTQYASGPSPIFFGAGYTDVKTWWKIGFLISLLHIAVLLGIGLPWWKFIGLW